MREPFIDYAEGLSVLWH